MMNMPSIRGQANAYLDQGENQRVADMKDALLAEGVENGLLLAQAYYRLERFSEAMDLCIEDDSVEASVLMAECLIAVGQFRNAAAILENVLPESPRDPRIWMNLGTCFFELKDFKKSWECLELSAEYAPDDPWVLVRLACCQWKNGFLDKATVTYNAAIQSARMGRVKDYMRVCYNEFLEATAESADGGGPAR